MKSILLFCISIQFFIAFNAFSNENSHERSIEELLMVMGKDKLLSQPETWTKNVEDQFGDLRNAAVDKEKFDNALKKLREFYSRVLTWERLKPQLIELYKSVFTENEAKELYHFFYTKLGQKFLMSDLQLSWKENEINKKILEIHKNEHEKFYRMIFEAASPIK